MGDSARLLGAGDELLPEQFRAIQTQMRTPVCIGNLARMHCNGVWGDTYLLAAFNVLVGFDTGYELKFLDERAVCSLRKAMQQDDRNALERIAGACSREPHRVAGRRGVLADYTLLNLANQHFLLLRQRTPSTVKPGSTDIIQTSENGNCFFDALAIMYEHVSGTRLSEVSMRRLIMCIMRRFFLTRAQRESLHGELRELREHNIVQEVECRGYRNIPAPLSHHAAVDLAVWRGAPRYTHIDVPRNQRQKRFDEAILP